MDDQTPHAPKNGPSWVVRVGGTTLFLLVMLLATYAVMRDESETSTSAAAPTDEQPSKPAADVHPLKAVANALLLEHFPPSVLKGDAGGLFESKCEQLGGQHAQHPGRSYYLATCEGLTHGLKAQLVWKDRNARTNPGQVFQARVDISAGEPIAIASSDTGRFPVPTEVLFVWRRAMGEKQAR